MTYSVWMRALLPEGKTGWSRIAGGLSQAEAERIASVLLFPARAMPDQEEK